MAKSEILEEARLVGGELWLDIHTILTRFLKKLKIEFVEKSPEIFFTQKDKDKAVTDILGRFQAQLLKAQPLIEKRAREELLNDLKDGLELIIRFMNTPEAKKDITDALRITLKDMMIGCYQSLKGGK